MFGSYVSSLMVDRGIKTSFLDAGFSGLLQADESACKSDNGRSY